MRYTGTVDVFGIGEALSISGSAGNPLVQVVGDPPFRYTPALGVEDAYGGNDINENGQVVGSMIVKRIRKAFRYTDGEGRLDLGVGDRKQGATAYAINDQGIVFGWYGRPFIYVDGFGSAPLDDLIEDSPEKLQWLAVSYMQQMRINNQGQIAVKLPAEGGGTGDHVLLLTPDTPPSEW